jgi:hypothetical protein
MAWMSLDFTLFVSEVSWIYETILGEDRGVFPLDVGFPSNRADGSAHLGTTRVNLSMEASAGIGEEEEKVGRGKRSVCQWPMGHA